MITTDCPNCGNAVFVFAGSCERCGAPNRARLGALAVAGSLLLLILALGITTFVVLRWQRVLPGPADDFVWLTAAMDECDAEAAKTPDTLHFLVVPMASSPADDETWRGKSLNDIGNAILLRQADTLDGLKAGSLRIATERYEFNMRDEATSAVYKWTPSVGVKKFLIPDGARIAEFKVQFTTRQKTNDAEWGAVFVHQKGTCYWVNAIIGH
jgi:hypothetical protein